MKIAKYQVSFSVFIKIDTLVLGLLRKENNSVVCIEDLFWIFFCSLCSLQRNYGVKNHCANLNI